MGKTRQSANLVSDNNLFVDITNDRVGIKTTNPQYDLDVLGNVNISGTLNQNGSIFSSGVGIQSGGTVIGYGITTLNFVGTGNTFSVNGKTVDISISGGGDSGGGGESYWVSTAAGIHTLSSVGIGTTNPTVSLQLSPDAKISNINVNSNFGTTAGTAVTVAQFYHFNGNGSYLRIKAKRNTDGSNWTTASTKLLQVTDVTEQGYIEFNPDGSTYGLAFGQGSSEYMRILNGGNTGIGLTNPSAKLEVSGVIKDAGGNVRSLPNNAQSTSYVLAAGDIGELINITTGGVTVPASVFSAGNSVTIYNNSGSSQTITQGSGATLRLAGTATTGNRTLAQRGITTITCVASNEFVISGAGLS